MSPRLLEPRGPRASPRLEGEGVERDAWIFRRELHHVLPGPLAAQRIESRLVDQDVRGAAAIEPHVLPHLLGPEPLLVAQHPDPRRTLLRRTEHRSQRPGIIAQ